MWTKPYDFYWVDEGRVAGMPRPSGPGDYEYLKESNVALIVTLTEAPLRRALLEEYGFEYLHLPIADFTPPGADQIDACMAAIAKVNEQGKAAVLHCFAGRGRTGTMAACYLVRTGLTSDEAIRRVRRLMPGSIETMGQEDAIHDYAARLRSTER